MAPAPPRSKLSRVIISKAKEWRNIIDELPLLEEFDNLEALVQSSREKLEALNQVEAAAKLRVDDLVTQEHSSRDRAQKTQLESDRLITRAKAVLKEAELEANNKSDAILAEANAKATEIVRVAEEQSEKIRSEGKVAADSYRDSLSNSVKDLEKRIEDLRKEEAEISDSHQKASEKLMSLRKQLGVQL